jgi:predicted nucleic acid-binding protein
LTLTEVTDGTARDVNVRRVVNAMRVLPVTDAIGYSAGRLRHTATRTRRKARDLTVDAVVAATALTLANPVVVLTSDPDDLRLLLQGTDVRVEHLAE